MFSSFMFDEKIILLLHLKKNWISSNLFI